MEKISTSKKWNELLPDSAVQQWLHTIAGSRSVTASQRSTSKLLLLYGAAKEDKIAAAALTGAYLKQDVYRVDASAIVSKYIGETEKNLEKIFLKSADKNWIFFFDEADALFGKRTDVKDSHDRYAGLSVLLQKAAQFPNPVLLGVHTKSQIPASFLIQFHAVQGFPKKKK